MHVITYFLGKKILFGKIATTIPEQIVCKRESFLLQLFAAKSIVAAIFPKALIFFPKYVISCTFSSLDQGLLPESR